MNYHKSRLIASLFLVLAKFFLQDVSAAVPGGFAVVLDKNQTNGDSKRSLVFYDTDDMSKPLFGVFLGTEASSGVSASLFEDPESITVNPDTGEVYVLAFDSGSPLDSATLEPDGDLDGRGDFDLLRVDFRVAYQDWQTNHLNTYVTYGDGTSAFDASHTNPQTLPAVVDKIGELGRSPGNGIAFSFASQLEFISPTQLAYTDAQIGDSGGNTDVQIRLAQQVNVAPGFASPLAGGTQGGFNHGTSESWESSISGDGVTTGFVNLDGPVTSDVVSTAVVRNRNGVTGMWILENDGDGDDLAFYDFATNSYRPIDVAGNVDTRISIDDDPLADDNLGNGDQVLVDPLTGDVLIVEQGYFNSPQHQPGVYRIQIGSYDTGGVISVTGSTSKVILDPSSYDDGPSLIDGRNAIYDWVNNAMFFFDEDNSDDTLMSGQPFAHDWYRLDLGTGVTTVVGPDADLSNGLFDIAGFGADDQVEFFYIAVPEPASMILIANCLFLVGMSSRRRRFTLSVAS